MRKADVMFKGEKAGVLEQHDDGSFTFSYLESWVDDGGRPPISLTLPKTNEPYHSDYLFPFFFNMLPEGSNKQVVCRLNKIDKKDYFGLLLTIAKFDTIGAVNVVKTEGK
jgi:serine/threonine-protein kinase HipA